jgi:hypothetical protein
MELYKIFYDLISTPYMALKIWQFDLQVPIQLVPVTAKVVSSQFLPMAVF